MAISCQGYFTSEWVSISLTILTWSSDIEGHGLTFTLSYHIIMAKAPELFFIEYLLNLQNFDKKVPVAQWKNSLLIYIYHQEAMLSGIITAWIFPPLMSQNSMPYSIMYYCQTQLKLQLQLQLELILALISKSPTAHPPTHPTRPKK